MRTFHVPTGERIKPGLCELLGTNLGTSLGTSLRAMPQHFQKLGNFDLRISQLSYRQQLCLIKPLATELVNYYYP